MMIWASGVLLRAPTGSTSISPPESVPTETILPVLDVTSEVDLPMRTASVCVVVSAFSRSVIESVAASWMFWPVAELIAPMTGASTLSSVWPICRLAVADFSTLLAERGVEAERAQVKGLAGGLAEEDLRRVGTGRAAGDERRGDEGREAESSDTAKGAHVPRRSPCRRRPSRSTVGWSPVERGIRRPMTPFL